MVESDQTLPIEGNEYFPPESINPEHFHESAHASVCYWKGTARY